MYLYFVYFCKMKKLFITLIILFSQLVGSVLAQTQQRDRRAELDIDCSSNFCISTTGQLWISTYCGKIFTADSISSTWRTVKFPIEQSDSDDYEQKPDGFESMATFGNQTAVAVGFSNSWDDYAYVLRTKDCGQHWDTVLLDSNLAGVRTCFSRSEGYIWIGCGTSRESGVLAYSADSGRTFQVIHTLSDEGGSINSICMINADSGFAGLFNDIILTTSDNWQTIHRMPTPMNQDLVKGFSNRDYFICNVCQWNNCLIVRESLRTFFTSLEGKIRWQEPPVILNNYAVDSLTGTLWAISDSNRLIRLTDWDHMQRYDLQATGLIGIFDGNAYCYSNNWLLRVSPEGKVDTFGLYTMERSIYDPLITFYHDGRKWGWGRDSYNIYMLDTIGWYRVATTECFLGVQKHPNLGDRVIFHSRKDKYYTLDTAGHVESFFYLNDKTFFFIDKLKNGDLLFLQGCEDDIENAICESTGNYTRVALIEVDSNEKIWVIEASPKNGVQRLKYTDWLNSNNGNCNNVYRLTVPFDTALVIARAKSFIGKPYDKAFLPDNDRLYSSELIFEAFLDSHGNHLFQNKPMNFRNCHGKLPKYWKIHFKELGIPIPKGIPGTNPTDLSKSEKLKRVL